jgi:nitrite reductase/ring-hydroxylating ferredoxin subunit
MMKFVKPEDITNRLRTFSANMAVTTGQFEIVIPGYLEDLEWNHMDQMHRKHIHNTYAESIRIATGSNFAISLTKWEKIPLFITVTDIRLSPGLFYQCMTIAGLIYVHLTLTMNEKDEKVYETLEWNIISHKWLKFLHPILNRKFIKLNTRLQIEDTPIREQRYKLRKNGYKFIEEPVNYYNSNSLKYNTIYPKLPDVAEINVTGFIKERINKVYLNQVGFLIKKVEDEFLIWPLVCPHEGGDLSLGKHCEKKQIQCSWHGLRFTALTLSANVDKASGYGFEFNLDNSIIRVSKILNNETLSVTEDCELIKE